MKNRAVKSLRQKRARKDGTGSSRILVLVLLITFFTFAIIAKLGVLQVLRYNTYEMLAENQHETITPLAAKRGEIFLQDEHDPYPVAVNRQMQMAYAVPREMKDINASIDSLAGILSLDKSFLQSKLSNPDGMFAILKHKLSDDESQKIRDAKIAGIYLTPEDFRYYPGEELASQVIGFVGSDGNQQKGVYGLESFWDDKLKGQAGQIQQEGDSRGRWITVSDRNVQQAQDGPDLILTINHTVQFEVEKILSDAINQFQADSGTIVVEEPKTGKILAMANEPSFNPNNYSSEDISTFNNGAVSAPYEAGSVFKAFTEAMGLEQGKIAPSSTYTDTGSVSVSGYTIHNASTDPASGYGVQTMTQVLEKSLNTGVIYIEKLVGNRMFADFVQRFGFGSKTGIELPGELTGNIKNLSNLSSDINFYTASFGQGITVTPIQLAAAYGALANGGTLMKPYIVDSQRFQDGHEEVTQPQEVRQVITQSTAQQVGDMLRDVVVNGNGKRADVPGYLVVGKTGTAQVTTEGVKGYTEGMTIGSFAGYAPQNDPKFVVIVKIVNPKAVQWAESSAAPTSGKIMKFLLDYYKVKPTEDPSTSPLAKLPPLQLGQVTPPQPAASQQSSSNKDSAEKKSGGKSITSD